jgi:hypothetical protein
VEFNERIALLLYQIILTRSKSPSASEAYQGPEDGLRDASGWSALGDDLALGLEQLVRLDAL